jgi:hypothetical protein
VSSLFWCDGIYSWGTNISQSPPVSFGLMLLFSMEGVSPLHDVQNHPDALSLEGSDDRLSSIIVSLLRWSMPWR